MQDSNLLRAEAAQDILAAAGLLYRRGLVNTYEGNISRRLGGTLLITPSAVNKEALTAADLVEVDLATGKTVAAAPGRRASSELRLHLCCYRSRPDIAGVAHAHPPYATAFALRREPIETKGYPEMILLYNRVPVCRYGRPGTEEINAEVPDALRSYDQFLLANHGLVTVGGSAMEAVYRLEGIESIARVLKLAREMGGETALPDEECAEIETMYRARRNGTNDTGR